MSTCVRQSCIRFTAPVFTHSRAYLFSRCFFPSASLALPAEARVMFSNDWWRLFPWVGGVRSNDSQKCWHILVEISILLSNQSVKKTGDFHLISFNICIVVCHFIIPYQLYWFWWWRGVSDNMWSLISSVNGSLGTLSLRQRWDLPF